MPDGRNARRADAADAVLGGEAGEVEAVAKRYPPDYGAVFTRVTEKRGLRASLQISAKIASIVCVIELAIMLAFSSFPGVLEGVTGAVLDAVILAAVSAPIILIWVIRPYIAASRLAHARLSGMNRQLRREIDERLAVEEKLRAHEAELELQIQEIDYVKYLMEKQAAEAVGLAEDLAAQKQEVEESERRNQYLANHDTLTGLANRRQFEEVLARMQHDARRSGESVTLIYVDLDHFKTVNDTLGHHCGDDLLIQVAERLRASVRRDDFVARLGGDEFAVVSTQFEHGRAAELRRFAERIRSALSIPVEAPGGAIPVSATLGVATFPDDAADGEHLLLCADRAMYVAKSHGRNCAVYYHDIGSDVVAS